MQVRGRVVDILYLLGGQLEVSTSTTLQYEAWNKVTMMFPNKELLQLKSGDELPTTLEEWNSRS